MPRKRCHTVWFREVLTFCEDSQGVVGSEGGRAERDSIGWSRESWKVLDLRGDASMRHAGAGRILGSLPQKTIPRGFFYHFSTIAIWGQIILDSRILSRWPQRGCWHLITWLQSLLPTLADIFDFRAPQFLCL